jgi:hypothetical protein
VAALHQAAARHPSDPELAQLVGRLAYGIGTSLRNQFQGAVGRSLVEHLTGLRRWADAHCDAATDSRTRAAR